MTIPKWFNTEFNRFEILKEAKSLSKNELKELNYRERKILNIVIKDKHFKQPYRDQETKYEIKLKKHLDALIEHKPIERSKISKVFFEVKNRVLQLATGDLYSKLHPGLNLSNARTYEPKEDMIPSFAADITGKPHDYLIIENKDDVYSVYDYDTKRPLLKIKVTPPQDPKEAHSASFLRVGKIANSDNILIAF